MLDAGCGSGSSTLNFVRNKKAEAVALDVVPEALRLTGYLFERANEEVSLILGDVLNLPFKDQSFDLVFSGGVIEHFEVPSSVLKEYMRVTKLGGTVITSVLNIFSWRFFIAIVKLFRELLTKGKVGLDQKYFTYRSFKKVLYKVGLRGVKVHPCAIDVGVPRPLRKYGKIFEAQSRILQCFRVGFRSLIGKGLR